VISLLQLLGISFVGSVFWVLNTEAAAVYYGGTLGYFPWVVGGVCATGQVLMHVVLYYCGSGLTKKWRWLRKKVERVRTKYGDKLEKRYLYLSFMAGIFGVPPVLIMAIMAPGFGVRLRVLVPVLFLGRIIRFTLLAWVGQPLLEWVQIT